MAMALDAPDAELRRLDQKGYSHRSINRQTVEYGASGSGSEECAENLRAINGLIQTTTLWITATLNGSRIALQNALFANFTLPKRAVAGTTTIPADTPISVAFDVTRHRKPDLEKLSVLSKQSGSVATGPTRFGGSPSRHVYLAL